MVIDQQQETNLGGALALINAALGQAVLAHDCPAGHSCAGHDRARAA